VQGLAARGMAVAGLARNGERLAAAMEEVAATTGSRTLAVPADVTDRAAVDEAVARVREELGVLLGQVGQARDGRAVADRGVGPVMVVLVQPGRQGLPAC
jgi:NAD(P)-dependent dehydrogenase (short-subunit alcohol dehydrogenase family)